MLCMAYYCAYSFVACSSRTAQLAPPSKNMALSLSANRRLSHASGKLWEDGAIPMRGSLLRSADLLLLPVIVVAEDGAPIGAVHPLLVCPDQGGAMILL